MKNFWASALAVCVLVNCGGDGSVPGLNSGIAAPGAEIQSLDRVFVSNEVSSTSTGSGFAYRVGSMTGDGFHAYSGILPRKSVLSPPSSGQATYAGVFAVGFMGDITFDADRVRGFPAEDTGEIAMEIDFGAGTMTASGTGIDDPADDLLNGNAFVVNGTFSGTQMTGTATYNGVSGPMEGLMGANEALGVFHGETLDQVHAGGFGAD